MKQNVHEVLDDLLLENKMSIVELSKKLKMDYKQVSNYANGIFLPNIKNAVKIADIFCCSVDYLAGLDLNKNYGYYSDPDYNFFERYSILLKDRNVSHYKLCKDIKININNSRNWKLGSLPAFTTLIKISEYLGESIDNLIGRKQL